MICATGLGNWGTAREDFKNHTEPPQIFLLTWCTHSVPTKMATRRMQNTARGPILSKKKKKYTALKLSNSNISHHTTTEDNPGLGFHLDSARPRMVQASQPTSPPKLYQPGLVQFGPCGGGGELPSASPLFVRGWNPWRWTCPPLNIRLRRAHNAQRREVAKFTRAR